MKEVKNGFIVGLTLQLAIGPVFFFITNLVIQKSFLDGLAGVIGVTLGDYFYIALSVLGIGKLLETKKIKKIFSLISSIVLIVFGSIMINGILGNSLISNDVSLIGTNLFTSFSSVFFLTLSSPLTIVLFTSLFTAKTIELNYSRKELWRFGFGTGLATFIFMGSAVVLFSLIRGVIPVVVVKLLNLIVGLLLIVYGGMRLSKSLGKEK